MKKAAKQAKCTQEPIRAAARKRRSLAVVGVTTALLVGVSVASYAAKDLLHGHVRIDSKIQNTAPSPAPDLNANASSAAITSPKATSDLESKYGPAAKSAAVAAAIRNSESSSGAKATAKGAAERYEALQHGIWKPGTDQTITLLHGNVPPGMPPQQAAMLYNALPRNARIPVMPQPMTPDRIAAMAGEPIDPTAGLPGGLSQADVQAANQQMVEGYMRDRFGPVYVPPLHRGHNHAPDPAAIGRVATVRDHQGSIREMVDASGNIVADYSYDPYGRQTKIAGSGPDADFGYQGYYVHQRSGLNLTATRAYSPVLGRFLNRDLIGEKKSDPNLFAYVRNNPISFFDPMGTDVWTEGPSGTEPPGHCSVCVGDPLGKYSCYSYGLMMGQFPPMGSSYVDTMKGGDILRYKKTTSQEDMQIEHDIVSNPESGYYGPGRVCCDYANKWFDKAKGNESKPPNRPPAAWNWPPLPEAR